MLDFETLKVCLPKANADKLKSYVSAINQTLSRFAINTPKRQAMFLAQVAHESGEFRWMEEIWGPTPVQLRYEGRKDLGNIKPGDGFRYKGRGPIQLTGRNNYRAAGKALGVDLEGSPELALEPTVAFAIAGWYWDSRKLNRMADTDDIIGVTKSINGGLTGIADRQAKWTHIKRVLGA